MGNYLYSNYCLYLIFSHLQFMGQLFVFELLWPLFNFLSFVFYFSWKIQVEFHQGHNGPFACKQLITGARARLCAKQYHLLHKLHDRAAPWWSSWSRGAKIGAEQSQTPSIYGYKLCTKVCPTKK
jgi:hypothetical protein